MTPSIATFCIKCRYAECRYAECRYADCRAATKIAIAAKHKLTRED